MKNQKESKPVEETPSQLNCSSNSRPDTPVTAWWIFIGILFVSEYLIISFLFDAQAFHKNEIFGPILGNIGSIAPIMVLIAAAIIVFRGPQLRAVTSTIPSQTSSKRRWLWIGLHAISYLGFIEITRRLHITAETVPTPSLLWIFMWGSIAIIVLLTGLFVVLPIKAFAPFIVGTFQIVLTGTLVGFLAWLGGMASRHLWRFLGGYTIDLTVAILSLFSNYIEVDRAGFKVGIDPFYVNIAPICSGFEGIGLMIVFLGMYTFTHRTRLRFPHVFVLIPVAVVLVWLLNGFRLALLIIIGRFWSPEIALGGFHSKAGWVFFCAVAVTTVFFIRHSNLFYKTENRAESTTDSHEQFYNPTAAYLLPLLAVIAISLVTDLFSFNTGFDFLYPIRVVVAIAVLWLYRREYRPFEWSWSWSAPAIGVVVFIGWVMIANDSREARIGIDVNQLTTWYIAPWIFFRAMGSVVTVPIIEELAFRSYAYRRLISRNFTEVPKTQFDWISLLISSVVFGILHRQLVAGTLAGVLYAVAQLRRGRTADAIVAHAVTNGLITGKVLLFREWYLWS